MVLNLPIFPLVFHVALKSEAKLWRIRKRAWLYIFLLLDIITLNSDQQLISPGNSTAWSNKRPKIWSCARFQTVLWWMTPIFSVQSGRFGHLSIFRKRSASALLNFHWGCFLRRRSQKKLAGLKLPLTPCYCLWKREVLVFQYWKQTLSFRINIFSSEAYGAFGTARYFTETKRYMLEKRLN